MDTGHTFFITQLSYHAKIKFFALDTNQLLSYRFCDFFFNFHAHVKKIVSLNILASCRVLCIFSHHTLRRQGTREECEVYLGFHHTRSIRYRKQKLRERTHHNTQFGLQ